MSERNGLTLADVLLGNRMTEVKFTDLEEVYNRLGNIPVKVSYITNDANDLFGEDIVIEAVGTPERKARLLDGENWSKTE